MFYFVRRVKNHYYLYKVYYDPLLGRKVQKLIGNCEVIEKALDGGPAGIRTQDLRRVRAKMWVGHAWRVITHTSLLMVRN